MMKWFMGKPESDTEIQLQFGSDVYALLTSSSKVSCDADPDINLATILMLDQFTRMLYRGTSRAFKGDQWALQLSLNAIASDSYNTMPPMRRAFMLMPFEHSESQEIQQRGVELFQQLSKQCHESSHAHAVTVDAFLKYAIDHQKVVERFKRFPHRNAALGRVPTKEEVEYLENGGETFGGFSDSKKA